MAKTVPKRLLDETQEAYLKRLNSTVFRCAVCNEIFPLTMMTELNISICKNCDQSGRADKFFELGEK